MDDLQQIYDRMFEEPDTFSGMRNKHRFLTKLTTLPVGTIPENVLGLAVIIGTELYFEILKNNRLLVEAKKTKEI